MTIKTVVIWDTLGQDRVQFFTSTEDLSRFHQVYCNESGKRKQKLGQELTDFIYTENGDLKVKLLNKFPIKAVSEDKAQVIVAGFLP